MPLNKEIKPAVLNTQWESNSLTDLLALFANYYITQCIPTRKICIYPAPQPRAGFWHVVNF